ncbi:MAG: hydrogenase maturation protease [Deltaproteobacteria bacterium]|nr:hydrogenase maturation protease [Deltaproteobacteria bacterium]
MRTLILGMGNPILSDDGVGLSIANIIRERFSYSHVDVASSVMIGLSLFDLIVGYDMLFIVDAMTSRDGKTGDLRKISEQDRQGTLHLFSSHGLNIFELMNLGRLCELKMPCLAAVYGIEIGNDVTFGSTLSPGLKEKLPAIAEEIIADITSLLPPPSPSRE